jgi:hypothetical protein
VRFNPWLVSDRASILSNFFGVLSAAISKKLETEIHNSRSSQISEEIGLELAIYATALAEKFLSASAFGLPIGISGLLRRYFQIKLAADRENRTNLALQKERVEALLADLNSPIIVLIDEMDRLEDSEVRIIAQLIKAVADFRSIAYVVAYDHFRVVEALGGTGPKAQVRGERYIEKLFEASVDVPIVSISSLRGLLETSLNLQFRMLDLEKLVGTEKKRFDEFCGIVFPALLENVRDVKRLLNAFYGRLHFTKYEVSWVDVLAYSLLSLKGKRIVFEIIRKQETFLSDHYTDLDHREAFDKRNEWLAQLLGDTSEPEVLRKLVGFLFPKLANKSESSVYARDYIRFEKSLSLVLRMEVAPGTYTREDFNQILGLPIEGIITVISELPNGAAIRSFLMQVAENAHAVDFDDIVFWRALASAIEDLRELPYSENYERRECARTFSELIWSFAVNAELQKVDVGTIIDVIVQQDLNFVASITVRRFQNRLRDLSENNRVLENRFDKNKFNHSVETLVSRLTRSFDEEGEFVDAIVFYLFKSHEQWSAERMSHLAGVLGEHRKLDDFVISIFGGNYSTDIKSLSEIIETDWLGKLVANRILDEGFKDEDDFLRGAYEKIAEILGVS